MSQKKKVAHEEHETGIQYEGNFVTFRYYKTTNKYQPGIGYVEHIVPKLCFCVIKREYIAFLDIMDSKTDGFTVIQITLGLDDNFKFLSFWMKKEYVDVDKLLYFVKSEKTETKEIDID